MRFAGWIMDWLHSRVIAACLRDIAQLHLDLDGRAVSAGAIGQGFRAALAILTVEGVTEDPRQITTKIRLFDPEWRVLIAEQFLNTASDLSNQYPAYARAYQTLAAWVKLVDLDERSRPPAGQGMAAILRRGSAAIASCEEAYERTIR